METSIPVFVGIDYADRVSQVVVVNAAGEQLASKRVSSDADRIVACVRRCGTVVGVAVEACCGAAALADELVGDHGWPVQLAHPGYVRRMKQNPDKTDYSDARLLADLRRVGYLPAVWLAPPAVRELRRVTRARQAYVEEARRVKLRVRALLRDHRLRKPSTINRVWTQKGVRWLNELASDGCWPQASRWLLLRHLDHLRYLETEIAACEQRLEAMTTRDSLTRQLRSHKGVGLVTACVLRAEIGRFERFGSGKQLAHYCGVTPHNASSGERQADAGLVRGGNRQLRLALIELAHRLKQYDEPWRAFAERLRQAGKAPCVIAAAIANRWVRQLYYELRREASAAA